MIVHLHPRHQGSIFTLFSILLASPEGVQLLDSGVEPSPRCAGVGRYELRSWYPIVRCECTASLRDCEDLHLFIQENVPWGTNTK